MIPPKGACLSVAKAASQASDILSALATHRDWYALEWQPWDARIRQSSKLQQKYR